MITIMITIMIMIVIVIIRLASPRWATRACAIIRPLHNT
jgi:hypothetical protein